MNESEFHRLADIMLTQLADMLEEADARGELELELQGGILTITLESGKQFIVNKHAPTRQIWLSSPVSGGLHFMYEGGWVLADGRELKALLSKQLDTLS